MRLGIVQGFAKNPELRCWTEVVEWRDARDHGGEGGGNLRVEIIGVVRVAVDNVGVNFGAEGFPELAGCAGEFDCCPALGHMSDGETVFLEPTSYRRDL